MGVLVHGEVWVLEEDGGLGRGNDEGVLKKASWVSLNLKWGLQAGKMDGKVGQFRWRWNGLLEKVRQMNGGGRQGV